MSLIRFISNWPLFLAVLNNHKSLNLPVQRSRQLYYHWRNKRCCLFIFRSTITAVVLTKKLSQRHWNHRFLSNSPYCQPYNSDNVSFENLLLDQLIIPRLLVRRNSVLVTHGSWRVKKVSSTKEQVWKTKIRKKIGT